MGYVYSAPPTGWLVAGCTCSICSGPRRPPSVVPLWHASPVMIASERQRCLKVNGAQRSGCRCVCMLLVVMLAGAVKASAGRVLSFAACSPAVGMQDVNMLQPLGPPGALRANCLCMVGWLYPGSRCDCMAPSAGNVNCKGSGGWGVCTSARSTWVVTCWTQRMEHDPPTSQGTLHDLVPAGPAAAGCEDHCCTARSGSSTLVPLCRGSCPEGWPVPCG